MTRALPCLLALICCAAGAWAGGDSFCFLQKVDVKQLSNATVITLEADGIIEISSEGMNMWDAVEEGVWSPFLERIAFTLTNVRGGAAPMMQIARYPVSHLEFSLPPGQRNNIGLRCTLVMYRPAMPTVFAGPGEDNWDYSRTWRQMMRARKDREGNPDYAWFKYGHPQVMIVPSANRDKLTITVGNDRPEEPEPQRPEYRPAASRLSVTGTAEALSVDCLHADPAEVVKAIGKLTGAPIMLDDPITSPVTAHLEDLPLPRLLATLAAANGLCLSQVEGAFHLSLGCSDTATAYGAGVSRALTLGYMPVKQALLLLPDVTLPYVRKLGTGNQLVLSGPRPVVERIAADVKALDQPAYQCRLKAWVIATEHSRQSLREVLARLSGGTTSAEFDSEGGLSVELGQPQPQQVLVQLRALAQTGRLQMQALPSIWCQNGNAATLFIGQKVYYWRQYLGWAEVFLDSVDVGTRLAFRPRTDGQSIIANVAVTSDGVAPSNELGPRVMRRSAKSCVRLQTGQLIVIGGLSQTDVNLVRDRPQALPPPINAAAAGKLRVRQNGEVAVLVQAEAALTPPVATMPDEPGESL